MPRRPEPVQVVKQRRDAALAALAGGVPFVGFLGIVFDRRGDELTAVMPFDEALIGNPALPALHGGATAAFLETAALIELAWSTLWEDLEAGRVDAAALGAGAPLQLPKTIDFTVDYLRSGLPRDAYARARVARSGRRYASVLVEAWQDNRARPFAQATGHFLMPEAPGTPGAAGAASRGPAAGEATAQDGGEPPA
jgi:acyl-coenzyme A thioesterase PaaI-like protein